VIVPLLLGALVGGGAVLSWRLLFPSPPPLQAAIDRLNRRNELVGIANRDQVEQSDDLFGRTIGVTAARFARNVGFDLNALEADLRLVGRPIEQHMAQKVLMAILGVALPTLLGVFWSVTGFAVPLFLPAGAGVALGIFFFFVPDLSVRSEAADRRTEFRQALGSYLDLVVISLAGGAGVESALRDAARIGNGWAFRQLDNALEVTALTGETPWAALARLGSEVGVDELSELAASISLAGTEGARVRESLAVKATSLRDHALAEAEAEALATTEKMAMPVVLLFLGFLILIGYPAIDIILSGF
jgi:tight adherence protein C